MYRDKFTKIKEGYTFDDVLLLPMRTAIEPKSVNISSKFSRHIQLRVPIVSSPMDTVTEENMSIAMARYGAIGIIHRNQPMESEVDMVKRVKRQETIIIRNVHTITPETSIEVARTLMKTHNIAGLPVVKDERLVGIVTKRDLEFAKTGMEVKDIMVRDVIT
ncbi:MAG: IMP dehydrogenase, partial [Thermoplasmata archaeon]